ncbi:secretion protein HlyD [Cytophagales bacterium WSM2-2]|nr:secretion protein HlyD [Cytophagales bacterium WSM2-2]
MTLNKEDYRKFAVAFAVICCSFLLLQCKSAEEKSKKKEQAAPAIETFELGAGKITTSLKIPGELVSFRDVDVYAKVSSFVKQINADIGTEVNEGQLLAVMEAPEIVSQLMAAESRLKSQQAIHLASKANYDRLVATSKTPGTISQNDLDLALSKMNSDYAQLEAAQASKREIAAMQNYLEIRAPFSGIISARNVSLGAYVGPSGKGSEFPMFTLNEQKRLRLVVYVPDAYSNYIHSNDDIQFTVKGLPNEKFTVKVKRLAGALDKKLRAQRIEMDVINDSKKLLPGMIAEVSFAFNSDQNALIVPKSAVVNSTERFFVIRINNNKAEWVDVKKGLDNGREAEIFGALKQGDILVTSANEEIRNGQEVTNMISSAKPK